jgi:N-acetylglucosamine transport system substrate-binding protein
MQDLEVNVLKKIICALTSCAMILAVGAGCHKKEVTVPKSTNQELTITYYDGIYGSDWIQAIAHAYELKNPSVKIKLEPDSKLDQKASAILENYQNVPDIMFLSNTNWEYWASKGYLSDLTGLFKTDVDNGKTLIQKIQPDYLTHCKLNGKYWVVPWDDGVPGFIYNKDMFNENNWQVPATMQDFYTLLPKIKAAGIVPIAWSGDNISDWNYAVNSWWAQIEGFDGVNDYLKMGSPEVYHQQGRLDALQEFYQLVGDKSNSIDNALGTDSSNASEQFFDSKAAMLLGGSWVSSQIGDALPKDFNMGIMQFPSVDGASDATINVDAAGGFAAIPLLAQHKSIAEDFLRFMSTDAMLELYTSITSSPRPFIYDAASAEGLDDFGKSVMNIWQKNNNVYLFSASPLYYSVFSDWPVSGAPYLEILSGVESPVQAFDENYEYVKSNWSAATAKLKAK